MEKLGRLRKINTILAVMLLVTSIETLLVLTQFSNPFSTWETIEFIVYAISMIVGFYIVFKELVKID